MFLNFNFPRSLNFKRFPLLGLHRIFYYIFWMQTFRCSTPSTWTLLMCDFLFIQAAILVEGFYQNDMVRRAGLSWQQFFFGNNEGSGAIWKSLAGCKHLDLNFHMIIIKWSKMMINSRMNYNEKSWPLSFPEDLTYLVEHNFLEKHKLSFTFKNQ